MLFTVQADASHNGCAFSWQDVYKRQIPIIATGGPTDDSIRETIDCGADAITYTPPTNAELFKKTMQLFRENL